MDTVADRAGVCVESDLYPGVRGAKSHWRVRSDANDTVCSYRGPRRQSQENVSDHGFCPPGWDGNIAFDASTEKGGLARRHGLSVEDSRAATTRWSWLLPLWTFIG